MGGKKTKPKRKFIFDKTVPLSNPRAVFDFDEHDIIIPQIVCEEIATNYNKVGGGVVDSNAREFIRILRDLIEKNGCTSTSKIPLGEGKGTLTIEEWDPLDKTLALEMFPVVNNDNLVIAAAKRLLDKKENVTIVSRDMMLQTKALNRGIKAEDYLHDFIKNVEFLNTEITEINVNELCVRDPEKNYYINQPLVTDANPDAIYIWNGIKPILVEPKVCQIDGVKIKPRGIEQRFAMHVLTDPEIKFVAITGAAGSGKTLLAIATALELVKNGPYSKIYVSRIPVALGEEKVGALPGGVKEKNDPYFDPIRDTCRILMGNKGRSCSDDQVDVWMGEKCIEPVYMSFIRGRTLDNAIVILDEAQNTTGLEFKTFATRPNDSCKIVVCGDIFQIDRSWVTIGNNGLSKVISVGTGQYFFARAHLPRSQRGPVADFFDKAL